MKDEISLSSSSKVMILPSAYDEDIFSYKQHVKKENKIIYTGSFYRFGKK